MTNLITTRARKNKRTAHMLANARKDYSIPLIKAIDIKEMHWSSSELTKCNSDDHQ